jgi:hypothetical protein
VSQSRLAVVRSKLVWNILEGSEMEATVTPLACGGGLIDDILRLQNSPFASLHSW